MSNEPERALVAVIQGGELASADDRDFRPRFLWLLYLLCLGGTASWAQSNSATLSTLATIERDIDRVLDVTKLDPTERLTLANEARAALERSAIVDPRLQSKACYGVAYATYLAGEDALPLLPLCFHPDLKTLDVDLYVNMSSLQAWMIMVNGDLAKSIETYEALLSEDIAGATQTTVIRVGVSYATALYQNGQVLASIERFQFALIEALEANNDPVVIAAGNNLIVILIESHMYDAANAWLERLAPTIARTPRSHYTDSLELHRLELLGELEDPAKAASLLQHFIDERPDAVPNISGNANEFLATYLCRIGRTDEALAAAQKAVTILARLPLELADAKLTLAEVRLKRGELDMALVILDDVTQMSARTPNNNESQYALRVRAMLSKLGPEATDVLRQFELFETERGSRTRQRVERDSRYFDNRRELQRQQTKLQQFAIDRVRLESEASTSAAIASEQRALAVAERKTRRLSITVLALLAGATLLVLLQRNRQRIDRELQEQSQEMNDRLTEEVEQKSAALRQQLGDQAALERSLAETRHNESIGRITGNVAHDFNNLLQVISLSTERLSARRTSPEEAALFEGTRAALNHARSIIRQLLAYARQQKLKPAPTRFADYLAQTEALFHVAVDDRIEFDVEDTSGNVSIVIDSSQFTTVLLNLLTNACNAMPNGGKLSLSARCEELLGGVPPFTNLAQGEYLIIEVTDNGVGMSERTLSRAFEPFFTNRATGTGTGLGLSSVYGFVKQSRGEVRIDSEPDEGTKVTLVFPATRDLQPGTYLNDKSEFDVKNMHILIVEDNQALVHTLSIMFEARQASVAHAASSDEARAILQSKAEFDLVISDVRMKGEHDGYELREWVRAEIPGLPVLLMTGYFDDERGGPELAVIHKPFTENELMQAMSGVLAPRA